jgi:hypothetical protein
MLRKFANCKNGLLLGLKYRYTPVSNYQIQSKVNPIVAVTLGNDKEKLLDIHFRVTHDLFSSSKTSSPGHLKTSSDFF